MRVTKLCVFAIVKRANKIHEEIYWERERERERERENEKKARKRKREYEKIT